ncbi:darcynin family protein [Acinetobacter sp. MB5]|uniref:darcynin family protein n=1 Tax=Acinetobacter sp. MB5 TaxID=2069438 RepID=UPI000DCF7F3A|nr:darcynin family protein [Acinetobacter sp. MB5]
MSEKYTFFMHLKALPTWLRLSREDRNKFNAQIIQPILKQYSAVNLRWYDAETFTTKTSDIAVFEVHSLRDYYFMVDALRDSPMFSMPYFELIDIFPAIEEGYLEYEASRGLDSSCK